MDSRNHLIALDDTMDSETLQHYGVKGMKWGVIRAKKRVDKATTKEGLNKATSSLQKHRTKAVAKIEKLEKKGVKLQKEHDKRMTSDAIRAAKLDDKATKKLVKANKWYTSEKKAMKLESEARRLEVKAKSLSANVKLARAKLEKNKVMIDMFNCGIKDIDDTLIEVGKKYIKLPESNQIGKAVGVERRTGHYNYGSGPIPPKKKKP